MLDKAGLTPKRTSREFITSIMKSIYLIFLSLTIAKAKNLRGKENRIDEIVQIETQMIEVLNLYIDFSYQKKTKCWQLRSWRSYIPTLLLCSQNVAFWDTYLMPYSSSLEEKNYRSHKIRNAFFHLLKGRRFASQHRSTSTVLKPSIIT